jgi:MFS family permease
MSAATAPLNRDIRVIGLIGVAHGVSHYYQLAFVTMLLIVRQEAGLTYTDVGLLAGIFYGVSGISQTAAGFAVDRFGARPILAGGLATIGLALGLISVAHSFAGFAAIAVIAGLGNCVFHPADFALLNSSVHQGRLGRAYSIHGVGGSLGWAAAPVMYFLDSMFGWVGAALIGAMPGLLLSALVWLHRSELVDHRVKVHAAAGQQATTPTLTLFLQPAILLCMVYFALLSANTTGIQQFAVPAWASMFGVSENYAALCLIVFIVGSAGGVLVGGLFADRVRRRHDRAQRHAARCLGQGLRLRLFRPRRRLVPGAAGVRLVDVRRHPEHHLLDRRSALYRQRGAGHGHSPDDSAHGGYRSGRVIIPPPSYGGGAPFAGRRGKAPKMILEKTKI